MILLINDDGIDHPGLRHLYAALRNRLKRPVLAVLPTQQRSGQSHAITLDRGLTVTPRCEENFFAFGVDGTPTDCVKIGISTLMPQAPTLVVSGINDGPNVGRSLFYSGTVGAAMEAAVEGFIALAVNRDHGSGGFEDAAQFAAEVAERLIGRPELKGRLANLNVPAGPRSSWKSLRVAEHGHSGFKEGYRPIRDARDHLTWRLHGDWVAAGGEGDSDAHLLNRGHPVLTLLEPDLNGEQKALRKLFSAQRSEGNR
jgi:5'-nucleotidase